ncbi:hypothetical protein, conserved [Eimeria tenella]|uniref:Uncharacterized protein n=1 Tax=Eimeria tenella TaxID=5802 RepID=U6L134_EIMTE|nr:hypothetical protein, conserved [Eimeria tenella]CDJ44112.1 hypothetical protein, conserved [Eimeria tenella]|eukprot:XP_013234861.1 hypothetical protein, conserved [Eimeria tenella]
MFDLWVEADRSERRLQRQLEQQQQQQQDEQQLRRQLAAAASSKSKLLRASPLWRIGRFLLDLVLLFHLRRGDMLDYVELGLGEETEWRLEPARDMSLFVLSLLRAAAAKRFGKETEVRLSLPFLKALILALKSAHGIEDLCERRRRRARPKTFATSLCRAAAAAAGAAAAAAGGDAAAAAAEAAAAADGWWEDSDEEEEAEADKGPEVSVHPTEPGPHTEGLKK